jgi:hypothetical protein
MPVICLKIIGTINSNCLYSESFVPEVLFFPLVGRHNFLCMHFIMPLQDKIHKELDLFFTSLEKEWELPLEFHLHVGLDCATSTSIHRMDICKFLSGDVLPDCPQALSGEFAYFSRTEFPPPTESNTIDSFFFHTGSLGICSYKGWI